MRLASIFKRGLAASLSCEKKHESTPVLSRQLLDDKSTWKGRYDHSSTNLGVEQLGREERRRLE
jgi:hypothetical protein